MKYIKFNIGKKKVAICDTDKYKIEPTLINKINDVHNNEKYITGFINYKNKMIDVYDISSIFNQSEMKKFDGLLFITLNEDTIAIKFDGFFKIDTELKDYDLVDVDQLYFSTTL